MAGMANWSQAAVERLATAVKRRRADANLTQLQVWKAGGPSNSTFTSIEKAKSQSISSKTLRKLDAGLDWSPGTAVGFLRDEEEASGPGQGFERVLPSEALAQIVSAAVAELERRAKLAELQRRVKEQLHFDVNRDAPPT